VLIADFAPHSLEIMREKYQHRRLGIADADMTGWLQAAGFQADGVVLHGKPANPGGLAVDIYCFHRA
jgi:ArsR family transcriptional regulator